MIIPKYWKWIALVAGISAMVTLFRGFRLRNQKSTPFTVSTDHIRSFRHLHLTQFYFEQIIPIEKKDKLKSLIIVPSTIEAYMDLDELKVESDSLNYKFTLPDVRLSDVNFVIDSAKIYGFKHFGIYFSDNAYSEAVEDIQSGFRIARVDVANKARQQGIEAMARNQAKDFIRSWYGPFMSPAKEIGFVELKD